MTTCTNPVYVGDGVYLSETEYGLVLTANHREPSCATDVIHLDPWVASALFKALRLKFGDNDT